MTGVFETLFCVYGRQCYDQLLFIIYLKNIVVAICCSLLVNLDYIFRRLHYLKENNVEGDTNH